MQYKEFNGFTMRSTADLYMVVDTETTMPAFVGMVALNEGMRKNVAIAKPLIYDFAYVVMNRKGEILKRVNHLVDEIFGKPDLMNLAFYASKLPEYWKRIESGEVDILPWETIIAEFIEDAMQCKAVCAYNAAFDFKKALPYTERYITTMNSDDMQARYKYLNGQKWHVEQILKGNKKGGNNPTYIVPTLIFRDNEYPIIDLWDVACKRLINIDKYRKYCLENGLWTISAQFFKTSAEVAFQYLMNQYDFIESHTALNDAEIEAMILAKALKKGKIEPCVGVFPFRELGTTDKFATEKGKKYLVNLAIAMNEYLDSYTTRPDCSEKYLNKVESMIARLVEAMNTEQEFEYYNNRLN